MKHKLRISEFAELDLLDAILWYKEQCVYGIICYYDSMTRIIFY